MVARKGDETHTADCLGVTPEVNPFRGVATATQRARIFGRRHDLTLIGFALVTFVGTRARAFGNWKHATDWLATLERYAYPVLGSMSVDRIRGEDVLRVLTPIWTRRPEAARRVRQRIRAVLRWCWAHGSVSENVAGEGIDGALPAMPAVKEHFRALPFAEVGAALETVEGSGASLAAKPCLRFLVLTAPSVLFGAAWRLPSATPYGWLFPAPTGCRAGLHRLPQSGALHGDPHLQYSSVVPARLIGRGVHLRVPGIA